MLPNNNQETNDIFFEEIGMRRLDDKYETGSDSESEPARRNMYEKQRNEMLKFYNEKEGEYNDEADSVTNNSKFYLYPGLKNLIDEDPVIDNENVQIHICLFQVNTQGKVPFLQFFMQKNKENDTISFPSFSHIKKTDPFLRAHDIIDVMSFCYGKVGYINYNGFLHDEKKENYYMFFDSIDYDIDTHDLYRNSHLWLLTIDELLNTQKVCENFHVDEKVTQFFQDNPEFIFLQDSNEENYEIPVIAYVGTTEKCSNFISTFGQARGDDGDTDSSSILGDNYYFFDYQHAIKLAMEKCSEKNKTLNEKSNSNSNSMTIMNWTQNQNKPIGGSIIRFALFMGKTKRMDSSINDNDLWYKDYDSLFLSDTDSELYCGIRYIVKEYEQQMPLTCHFFR